MATLKYKNGSSWTTVPMRNGTHTERWSSASVTRSNNVYGTPTATVEKVGVDAAGACSLAFTFSNLRGAPGGTGGTGPVGNRGTALYSVCGNRTTALSMVNLTTDTFTSMRIAINSIHIQSSWDGYALGAYPLSFNSTYGNIYAQPNTTDYYYHIGLSGGCAITGVRNAAANNGVNASVKIGIAQGTSAATPTSWFTTFPIYWLTYQRQVTSQERMTQISALGSGGLYFTLCGRRNGGDPGSYDNYQSYLTATFYGRST